MPSNPVKVISLRKAMDRNDEARIAAVIAEFGGDVDASAALTRMAEEISQRLGHRARPGAGHGRAVEARVEELEQELASAKAQVGVGVGSARGPDFWSPISGSDLRLHRPAE